MLLVDSTRAGKRMPDALSKTVPIWCAVINRAVSLRYPELARFHDPAIWNTKLYTPPGVVSVQEHTQISELLDSWAHDLAVRPDFHRTPMDYCSNRKSRRLRMRFHNSQLLYGQCGFRPPLLLFRRRLPLTPKDRTLSYAYQHRSKSSMGWRGDTAASPTCKALVTTTNFGEWVLPPRYFGKTNRLSLDAPAPNFRTQCLI